MENAVPGKLNFSKAFADAFEVYKRNFLILALATLLLQLIATLSLFFLAGPVVGGFYWMMLSALRSESKKVDLGLMFKPFNRFWSLIGLFYLQMFVVVISLMLFIIPGMFFSTVWLFSFIILVDRKEGVISAMKSSWRLIMKKGFWPNLLLCVIYFVLTGGANWLRYIGWFLSLALVPIGTLLIVSAYIQQDNETEPNKTSE